MTVPGVVGCHLRVNGWPAVADRPDGGMLKAFCANASSGALSKDRQMDREKRMMTILVGL